jgi:hypothetical protein
MSSLSRQNDARTQVRVRHDEADMPVIPIRLPSHVQKTQRLSQKELLCSGGRYVMILAMIPKLFCRIALAALCAHPIVAQEIKVDFNANNRPLSKAADTAYTSWNTNSIWLAGNTSLISNTFSGVTFTFERVGPTGIGFRAERYAAGLTTPGWNAKLVSDGLEVDPSSITNIVGSGQSPARIDLTISNLTAGPHTLLTWHNAWHNPTNKVIAPLNIYVNGTKVITNLYKTSRVTNNADAAYSYVSFVADGTNNVVIGYEASVDFYATDANPSINGFELEYARLQIQGQQTFSSQRG